MAGHIRGAYPGVKILQMGIGKAPLIGAADTDVTPVKKKEMFDKLSKFMYKSSEKLLFTIFNRK